MKKEIICFNSLIKCSLFIFAVLVFANCSPEKTHDGEKDAGSACEYSNYPIAIKHAQFFSVEQFGSCKRLVVVDPWRNGNLCTYVLHPKGANIPDSIALGATLVEVPVKTIGCLSSTHIGALALLGLQDRIVGVSSAEQVFDSIVAKRFKSGQVKEIGRQMNTNVEQVIALAPDLIMKSGYDNVRNHDARFLELGLPVAYNIEWMENDLLARAEWIKFEAAFFCKDKEADSIFSAIEQRYNDALAIADSVTLRPRILIGIDYKNAWHLAGEESYVAKMIRDAGADFIANGKKGSTPLNFEQVLKIHADDDIWLNWMHQGISSLEVLEKSNERYTLFKAFQNGEVYNHDKRLNPAGGNDFWESGVSNPDLLLKDLIKIFHPELLPGYEMVYWRKLPKEDATPKHID